MNASRQIRPSKPVQPRSNSRKPSKKTPFRKKVVSELVLSAASQRIDPMSSRAYAWDLLRLIVEDATQVLGEEHPFLRPVRDVIRSKDLKGLFGLEAVFGDPAKHDTPEQYFAVQTVLSFFKKATFWDTNILDPQQSAIRRFNEAELMCRNANRRIEHYRRFDFNDSRPLTQRLRLHEVFHLARRKISSWIGSVDAVDFENGSRFGPGGTLSLSRPRTDAYFKLPRSGPNCDTVSSGAYFRAMKAFIGSRHLLEEAYASHGLTLPSDHSESCVPTIERCKLFDSVVEIADYNKVTFVPKNAKTHRSIAIEPDWNIQFQLAVGDHLKKKLKLAGIDLKDQSRNQHLALEGSTDDGPHGPVTIDLSMASDTVSIEIVRELLPPEWFELLDSLRSHNGRLDGRVFKWAKFSSMGNGFTFELESLIFYSLAQAVSDLLGETEYFSDTYGHSNRYGFISVFGDDIIVPKNVSDHLIEVLKFCGFRTNKEKTFLSGPFRESCGSDFWAGHPVRVRYFDGALASHHELIQVANLLVSLSENQYGWFLSKSLIFSRISIPEVIRDHLVSPELTLGFDALFTPVDLCQGSFLVSYNAGYQCFSFPSLLYSSTDWRSRADRMYRAKLYHLSRRKSSQWLDIFAGSSERLTLPSKELRLSFRTI